MKRISLVLYILISFFVLCKGANSEVPLYPILREQSLQQVNFLVPNEQRDEKYVKFLSVSVKITVQGSAGSGTICYYDSNSNWAYVISCGHLWQGEKTYSPENKTSAKITVWYKNDLKLEEPQVYESEALFWSNKRGYDCSLLRFQPDWTPSYFPIASHFEFKNDQFLNSMGCDGGKEVARYQVKFEEYREPDIITKLNSPRPGRSGGGLLTDEGELVGVCWGTSDISSGNGIGYFTPIESIKTVFDKNKHQWLLNVKKDLESIPIRDWENPSSKYDRHYVPVPNFILLF